METRHIKRLLESVAAGTLPVVDALTKLRALPFEDIGFAHIDHHRALRKGFGEVVYGQDKSTEQIIAIVERLIAQENGVLVTRLSPEKAEAVRSRIDRGRYDAEARMFVWQKQSLPPQGRGTIVVLSAGTSDIPVAREAALTAEVMGNAVETIIDVGVAGIHRLFDHHERIQKAAVLVVVAGMEGALPSVVAGLVAAPVIAVPTSVGYGTSLGGLTALLAMLNSCSSNVAVVNIDNGFGAGYMAAAINRPLMDIP
jgi:NCAIR mutase (PurE)-related protein